MKLNISGINNLPTQKIFGRWNMTHAKSNTVNKLNELINSFDNNKKELGIKIVRLMLEYKIYRYTNNKVG